MITAMILHAFTGDTLAGALAWLFDVASQRPRSSIRRSQRAYVLRTPCAAGSTGQWSRSAPSRQVIREVKKHR